MKLQNLQDCFETKLNALYDIETQIVKALPKLVKGAHDQKLKEALKAHLEETKGHVERLDEIFTSLEISKKKIKVEAIRGLADDAAWVLDQSGTPEAMDSLLISSAQYVEHYEIAGYTAAATWAGLLGFAEAEDLLEETLAEEQNADSLLSDIAEDVNERANMTLADGDGAGDVIVAEKVEMAAETGDEIEDPVEAA